MYACLYFSCLQEVQFNTEAPLYVILNVNLYFKCLQGAIHLLSSEANKNPEKYSLYNFLFYAN